MQPVRARQTRKNPEIMLLSDIKHSRTPSLTVDDAADLARVSHQLTNASEKVGSSFRVRRVSVERLAEQRDAAIATDEHAVEDLLEIGAVIFAVTICHLRNRRHAIDVRPAVLFFISPEERERRRVEVNEFHVQIECSNQFDGNPRHQLIDIKAKEIIERLAQSLFREIIQVESGILHDRLHVIVLQSIA